jgi:hypothetical protein
VAYETGGEVHPEWNVPKTDVIGPEGEAIQVKTGRRDYIAGQRDKYPDDVEIHSGTDGDGLDGITAHDFSDSELESAIHNVDSLDVEALDVILPGIGGGMVLSAIKTFRMVKNGELRLYEAPKEFVIGTGKSSLRVAVIGVAVATGQPIFVTTAASYLLYKNRRLLGAAGRMSWNALTHHITQKTATQTVKGLGYVLAYSGQTVTKILTAPTTGMIAKNAIMLAGRGGWGISRGFGKGVRWVWKNSL